MIAHLAGLVVMIFVSHSSDRRLERRYHAAVSLIVGGIALILLGTTSSALISITLWSIPSMGNYGFEGPFWSLPSDFLTGTAAASGIALVTSIGSLGGFVGTSIVGAAARGAGGIYRGLAIAGISFFVSASLALMLPKNVRRASVGEIANE